MYAYEYTFCRRAIVATFGLSAHHLGAFLTVHWLSNELTAIVLKLTEEAYVDAPLLPIETSPGAPVVAAADSPQRKRRLAESASDHHIYGCRAHRPCAPAVLRAAAVEKQTGVLADSTHERPERNMQPKRMASAHRSSCARSAHVPSF